MSKYGSSTVWFLIGGFSALADKVQDLRCKIMAITEPTHGLGDSWEEHTPTGISSAELAQDGAFFDSSPAGSLYNLYSPPGARLSTTSSPRVACLGFSGQTTGQDFEGIEGTFAEEFEMLSKAGNLTRANAKYVVTGHAETGKIIRALAATTGDTTQFLDYTAQSTAGGAAYFQVTSISMGASTGIALTVLESAATSTAYTAVATVTTTGIGGWRVAATDDTIERYLSATVDFSSAATSGSPSITCFIGFARI